MGYRRTDRRTCQPPLGLAKRYGEDLATAMPLHRLGKRRAISGFESCFGEFNPTFENKEKQEPAEMSEGESPGASNHLCVCQALCRDPEA